MMELEHLTAGYGEKIILHDLSLAFPPGIVTAIVGPNGCGKSTLLKAAAGLIPPVSGAVRTPEPLARSVAYLPQSRRLPEMTAGQLVLHGRFPWLDYPRRYREKDRTIAKNAMARLGVAELWDTPLSQLSGGTRQKCCIAMTLTQDTPTILLDEPASFLDVAHQLRLMELCRELAAEGRAVALVLHDLPLALRYADRILLLEQGRITAEGTPHEVLASGALERAFGVRILRLGSHFVCERED